MNWLDKYEKAQHGVDERYQAVKTKDNIPSQYRKEDKSMSREALANLKYQQLLESTGEIKPTDEQGFLSKSLEVLINPATAFGYAARNQSLPDNFSRGERNATDYALDIINPVNYANDAADLGYGLVTGNLGQAGVGALGLLPLGLEARNIGKAISPAVKTLPKAKSMREAVGTFKGIPTERSLPRLADDELKIYRQVQDIGRMRASDKPISEQYKFALENNLPDEHLKKVFGKNRTEIEKLSGTYDTGEGQLMERIRNRNAAREAAARDRMIRPGNLREEIQRMPVNEYTPPNRGTRTAQVGQLSDDEIREAVRRHQERSVGVNRTPADVDSYIDLDSNMNPIQRSGTTSAREAQAAQDAYVLDDVPIDFDISEVINNRGYNFKDDIGDLNDYTQNIKRTLGNRIDDFVSEFPVYRGYVRENVPSLFLKDTRSMRGVNAKVNTKATAGIRSGDVFTGSTNTSHSSYLPQLKQVFKYSEGTPQFLGHQGMNDLGFLSNYRYSPEEIAKYLNSEIDIQVKRGIIPGNVQRPFAEGKRVKLPHYGIKQNKHGGIIEDDRGQWAHPGEVTKINSNEITMQGVDYPVLGISDIGDQKLMQPGKDYKFEGESVIEYPLQKTNKKSNFTSPNNWLDKYSTT